MGYGYGVVRLVVFRVLPSGVVVVNTYGHLWRHGWRYASWADVMRSREVVPWLMSAASWRVRHEGGE